MPQCIVLNVTDRDEWIDQDEHPNRKRAIGLHVPAKDRPGFSPNVAREVWAAMLAASQESATTRGRG